MQTSIITFDGKLDNLVGFKNNKGTYSLRKRIKPANPQTKKQIVARARFKAVSLCAQDFKRVLFGLYPYAKQQKITLRNAFMKLNYDLASTSDPMPEGVITSEQLKYTELQLTKDTFNGVIFQNPDFSRPGVITVVFENPQQLAADDIVHLVAYIPSMNLTVADSTTVSQNIATIQLPTTASGEEAHLFGFTQHFNNEQARIDYAAYIDDGMIVDANAFSSAMGSDFSRTEHLGKGTIG